MKFNFLIQQASKLPETPDFFKRFFTPTLIDRQLQKLKCETSPCSAALRYYLAASDLTYTTPLPKFEVVVVDEIWITVHLAANTRRKVIGCKVKDFHTVILRGDRQLHQES